MTSAVRAAAVTTTEPVPPVSAADLQARRARLIDLQLAHCDHLAEQVRSLLRVAGAALPGRSRLEEKVAAVEAVSRELAVLAADINAATWREIALEVSP